MPFAATWMDLEIIILSEVSQTEKDKYITSTWNLKNNTNELIFETNGLTQKTKFWLPKEKIRNLGLTDTHYLM